MNSDIEHLRLLSIFHYVAAAVLALAAFLPCIYFFLGTALLVGAVPGERGQPPPAFIGVVLIGVAMVGMAISIVMAVCVALTARHLANRTGYMFCLVIAAIECLSVPLGTILGVFTIVVLMRPSVRQLFGVESAPQSPYASAP